MFYHHINKYVGPSYSQIKIYAAHMSYAADDVHCLLHTLLLPLGQTDTTELPYVVHSLCNERDDDYYLLFRECCSRCSCLQCFDAVGWAAGRASGL